MDFFLIFVSIVSGVLAIVASFVEARKKQAEQLKKRINDKITDEAEENATLEKSGNYIREILFGNKKLRNRRIERLTLDLLGFVMGVLTIVVLLVNAGTIVINYEPTIIPASPDGDQVDQQENDIHSFVLKYNKLFKNSIVIDWESWQINEEQRYYLENTLSETGISISSLDSSEKDIDWETLVDDDISYVLVRIGGRGYESGKIYLDKKYAEYMEAAAEIGIKVGCYFYSQAINQEEADEEIEQIVKSITEYKNVLDYPIGISLDRSGRASNLSDEECIDLVKYMCIKLLQAGYIPMIMGNTEWYEQFPIGTFNGYLKLVSSKEPPQYIDNCIIWEYDENAESIVVGVKNAVELSMSTYGLLQ